MVANNLNVGLITAADGSQPIARANRTGSQCVVYGNSYYSEPANRGKIFEACNAVAGVAPGTAFSTTPPMTIWNPPNSGVFLNILKISMGYVSGTLGAGSIAYGYTIGQSTAPSTGTALTPVCTLLGAPAGQGKAYTGSTITAAPSILRTGFTIGAFVGGANPPVTTADVIDGAISVPPGTCFSVQGIATAGTSPLAMFSVAWEEVPM